MFKLINKLKNRKGFTLIELIVVLAVLGVIMAIAVPRFTGVQEKAKIDADYSTGAIIAKAAELYIVTDDFELPDSGTDTISLSVLTGKYLDDVVKFQYYDNAEDLADVTISVDDIGSITVTANKGSDTETLYPDNR